MDLKARAEIARALRNVWDIIGDDCLKLAEDQSNPIPGTEQGKWAATMTAEEVRCVAADSSLGTYEPEACAIFRELTRKEKNVILKEAFPDGLYGY